MLSWIYAIVMLLVIASNLQTFAYYQEWMTPSGASAEPPLRRSRHTYAPRLEIRQWRHVAWWQHYRWLQSK